MSYQLSQTAELSIEQQMSNELQAYLSEPVIQHDNMNEAASAADPFKWWATNRTRFRNLATVARKYLGIPATSVSSERLSSTAGVTVGTRRGSLKPEHVEQIVFLHQNLR